MFWRISGLSGCVLRIELQQALGERKRQERLGGPFRCFRFCSVQEQGKWRGGVQAGGWSGSTLMKMKKEGWGEVFIRRSGWGEEGSALSGAGRVSAGGGGFGAIIPTKKRSRHLTFKQSWVFSTSALLVQVIAYLQRVRWTYLGAMLSAATHHDATISLSPSQGQSKASAANAASCVAVTLSANTQWGDWFSYTSSAGRCCPFWLTIQPQRCIKMLCPSSPEFDAPLALNCQKGQQSPSTGGV